MAMRRELFPVTQTTAFLNNAAESPLSTAFHEKLSSYLATALAAPQDRPAAVRAEVRAALAALLGGLPSEYALMSSTAQGLNAVAAGVAWQAGDNCVLPGGGEHWSNTFPWLALQPRGVEVRLAPLDASGAVQPEALAALVDARTRVVAAAHVSFSSGARTDLPRLSALVKAKNAEALVVVDGIQGAGACPLRLGQCGVDAYAAGGFKWLLGMPGTGFLWVSAAAQARIAPTAPGMFSADQACTTAPLAYHQDARRYEGGSLAYSLFHAWTAGLAVLQEVGVEAIHARNLALTGLLLQGLAARPHVRVLSPVRAEGERSAIVAVTLGSAERNEACVKGLAAAGVVVALRGGVVRIAVNFFNSEEDIGRLLEHL
jgi:cysteine desulfurase/selenocysteine lyase